MSYDRKRAIDLGSVNLSDLLTKAGLASILAQLTAAQTQQLQSYLDAAVLDPVIKQEADAIYRKGTMVNGQIAYTDPAAQRQIDRKMREYIPIHQLDDTVRLDLSKLLDSKALAPITDNPDEANYLDSVRKRLDQTGVWLRIEAKLVHDPDDPSAWINDGKHFDVWLSLGPRGDTIPAKGGRIDREALISTEIIGANYFRLVDQGPILTKFERQANALESSIQDGIALHAQMVAIRAQAGPGVVAISDLFGGASLPSVDMWDAPSDVLVMALQWRNKGQISGANCLLAVGAINARYAARVLNAFVDDTSAGAGFAARALRVVKFCSEVVGAAVAIFATGGMLAGAGAGAGAGGATVAASEAAEDTATINWIDDYASRRAGVAHDLKSLGWAKQPKGTVLSSFNKGGVGFHVW
jgi:hypothetical protein